MSGRDDSDPLAPFHPAVRAWFAAEFAGPTWPQKLGWPAIARGESTLILAPTGSGKTLAAFLWCLDRLMFSPAPAARAPLPRPLCLAAEGAGRRCRAQSSRAARGHRARSRRARGAVRCPGHRDPHRRHAPCRPRAVPAHTGRHPDHDAGIPVPAPDLERARRARVVDTIIVDEIHALVPTKRGAHLAVSIERLAALCGRAPQRIGLSATQRPLDEVARFLGGVETPAADRRGRGRSAPARVRIGRHASSHEFKARSPTSSRLTAAPYAIGRSPSSTPANGRRSS